jgi:hypothetical protein
VLFGQFQGTINDPRSHHDNPIPRLEMAFERADRSRCIVFGNLTDTGAELEGVRSNPWVCKRVIAVVIRAFSSSWTNAAMI